jgi:membrane fusion protein, multidrug efflux system
MRSRVVWIAVVLIAVVLGIWAVRPKSTSTGSTQTRGPVSFPVEVALIEAQRVEYEVMAVGSVEAFEVVQVTARVSGVVERVLFAEGTTVTVGQVLAEVEPERYRIAVTSARATLSKMEAARAEAEAGLARREAVDAENPGLIPGEELESWRTRVRTATAEADQERSALALAELNLRDAFVRAPVAGIMQTRTVETGQYVQPGNVLATLVRRDPLLLRFQVPEHDAGRLRPGLRAFFSVGEDLTEYGSVLQHVSERADPGSRMVSVTAEVDGADRAHLRPGAFARVRVPVGGAADAPVIPEMAVRPSDRGFLAYVVKDSVAHERVLALGMRTADGLVEVRHGLKAGEWLVVRGGEAISNGSPVRVVAETTR